MARTPTGTVISVAAAAAIAAAKTVTAITNAANSTFSSVAHGYAVGDILLVSSTAGALDGRVVRVKTATTDSYTIEGVDTTDTTKYPAGTTATTKKITPFTEVDGVLKIDSSGGDAKSATYRYIRDGVERSSPDGFSAVTFNLTLDADKVSTASHSTLQALTDASTLTVAKLASPNGSVVYLPCMVSYNSLPKLTDGQVSQVMATLNGQQQHTYFVS